MKAYRDGEYQYDVGYTGQGGINYPWIGKTWGPLQAEGDEIAAAQVWDRTVNGYPNSATSRWSVKK